MKISTATSASLGEKLAGLDLTDEEGVLLTTLLNAEAADEVEGFNKGVSGNASQGYTEVEWTYRKNVLDALPKGWIIIQSSPAYTQVEWDPQGK